MRIYGRFINFLLFECLHVWSGDTLKRSLHVGDCFDQLLLDLLHLVVVYQLQLYNIMKSSVAVDVSTDQSIFWKFQILFVMIEVLE